MLFSKYIAHNQRCRNEFESGGREAPVRRKAALKKNFVVPLHFFLALSGRKISRFGERFRDGQYSLVSLLFAVLLNGGPVPRKL